MKISTFSLHRRLIKALSLRNVIIAIVCASLYRILSFHNQMLISTKTEITVPSENSLNQRHVNLITTSNPLDKLLKNNKLNSLIQLIKYFKKEIPTVNYAHNKEIANIREEIERCKRYGFSYDKKRKARRRIFFGSLIADDSWNTLLVHAIEAYGLYHSVAFIESNKTTSEDEKAYRDMRFILGSDDLNVLQSGIFGPSTKVTVDYYVDDPRTRDGYDIWKGVEHMQRDMITQRWKQNGMTIYDIGIISDTDEMFSRDFLLAAQTCDIPEFRLEDQNCKSPKILAKALVFESSPECIVKDRVWFHPDMMIGKCIDRIGDSTVNKPGKRAWNGMGPRLKHYGEDGDYSLMPNVTNYPLWTPEDFRLVPGGRMISDINNKNTGYHLHNFFPTVKEWRNKYLSYSHPVEKAMRMRFGKIHQDLSLAVNCAMDRPDDPDMKHPNFPDDPMWRIMDGFSGIVGNTPIAFRSDEFRAARHEELKRMIEDDEMERIHAKKKQKQKVE